MVALAVKLILVPEQIEVLDALMEIVGVTLVFTVMVIALDVAVVDDAVVSTQVMTSLFAKLELV